MLFGSIKIGDRIEIRSVRDLGKAYISQVEEIIDHEHLLVHVPISYGKLVKLSEGATHRFLFFTDEGMIRFDASVIDYTKAKDFHLMRIKILTEGEKMQRRNFFRFACLLDFKYAIISDDAIYGGTESPMYNGIIKDIGGGGVRFVCNDPAEEGSRIKCLILLNDDYFIVIGKVLQKQYFPKATYKYQLRAIFTGILPIEQERIVQFIFSEQRKVIHRI